MKYSNNLLHIILIFYCNERVYITEVHIDIILFLFWKDNNPYVYHKI